MQVRAGEGLPHRSRKQPPHGLKELLLAHQPRAPQICGIKGHVRHFHQSLAVLGNPASLHHAGNHLQRPVPLQGHGVSHHGDVQLVGATADLHGHDLARDQLASAEGPAVARQAPNRSAPQHQQLIILPQARAVGGPGGIHVAQEHPALAGKATHTKPQRGLPHSDGGDQLIGASGGTPTRRAVVFGDVEILLSRRRGHAIEGPCTMLALVRGAEQALLGEGLIRNVLGARHRTSLTCSSRSSCSGGGGRDGGCAGGGRGGAGQGLLVGAGGVAAEEAVPAHPLLQAAHKDLHGAPLPAHVAQPAVHAVLP
eukprot:RCo037890